MKTWLKTFIDELYKIQNFYENKLIELNDQFKQLKKKYKKRNNDKQDE